MKQAYNRSFEEELKEMICVELLERNYSKETIEEWLDHAHLD